ncbi:uncharacterized protein A4U43_C07F23700 [Asparagus officinalis]|uniref:Uncharacterized protein n=1 Tax=Asparagus officinalis TaxID=4686 RepID=A0A5P1EEG2_ASPOF|nr:uncharacterized protein LOC109849846 [Asparagus officinalis]XP_020275320.1 uncharacterized protein LOC109849846 [Asparagus officinalis]ONK64252.1 uncharacterized protein A4U43_C07F23700 [Asparagus officinalis]
MTDQYTSFHCENTKLSTSESIMSTSAENSRNSKEKIATNDTIMASVGAKRQHPDSSLSSSSHQSHVNRGVNGHLVYVRRKLSQNVDSSSSLLSMKLDNELKHELKVQQDKAQECNNEIVDTRGPSNLDCKAPDDPKRQSNQDPSPPIVPLDTQELVNDANAPVNHQIAPIDPQRARYQNSKSPADLQSNQHSEKTIDPQRVSNQYCNARVCPQGPSNQHSKTPPVDPQRSRTQDWKQRYIQLQAFLKNCEQSSLEDYKQMFRPNCC